MLFEDTLIQGKLIKRYKRFFADVKLDSGRTVVAHCANSGSMISVREPGSVVWISPARNPERKLKYTWELIRINNAMIGVNTNHPNTLVNEAIDKGIITELQGYDFLKREVRYGENSRIDILLENLNGSKCYVEVKNVTMKRDLEGESSAEFPDGVTARGLKHLVELSNMVVEGHRAVMVYLVQRDDCNGFRLARDIDPEYGKAYDKAIKIGVEILGYTCQISPFEINVIEKIKVLG